MSALNARELTATALGEGRRRRWERNELEDKWEDQVAKAIRLLRRGPRTIPWRPSDACVIVKLQALRMELTGFPGLTFERLADATSFQIGLQS